MRGDRRRSGLTSREREVLDLVRVGLTNEEIAKRLGISPDTAKYHVSQILAKLGVASREQAAMAAVRESWWQRLGAWGLAAKIALAAATAGVVGGIAVLALGVASSAPATLERRRMSVRSAHSRTHTTLRRSLRTWRKRWIRRT
jgi:DNA-binding CsgD family transcriptional regulator